MISHQYLLFSFMKFYKDIGSLYISTKISQQPVAPPTLTTYSVLSVASATRSLFTRTTQVLSTWKYIVASCDMATPFSLNIVHDK